MELRLFAHRSVRWPDQCTYYTAHWTARCTVHSPLTALATARVHWPLLTAHCTVLHRPALALHVETSHAQLYKSHAAYSHLSPRVASLIPHVTYLPLRISYVGSLSLLPHSNSFSHPAANQTQRRLFGDVQRRSGRARSEVDYEENSDTGSDSDFEQQLV